MSIRTRLEKLEQANFGDHRVLVVIQQQNETPAEARQRFEIEKAAWDGPSQYPQILVTFGRHDDECEKQN